MMIRDRVTVRAELPNRAVSDRHVLAALFGLVRAQKRLEELKRGDMWS
jgi:hypothetical protein